MDIINMLREDSELSELLYRVCDVEIFPGFKTPQNEAGHLTYNIPGKTFAGSASGSEYILLDDGSVGFWGSEGECGRLADSTEDFFEFIINCPCWQDHLDEYKYGDMESLEKYAESVREEQLAYAGDSGYDLSAAQERLADGLGLAIYAHKADILMRFYKCAVREPRFISTFTEDDGSVHRGTGSVFDR